MEKTEEMLWFFKWRMFRWGGLEAAPVAGNFGSPSWRPMNKYIAIFDQSFQLYFFSIFGQRKAGSDCAELERNNTIVT